MDLLDYLRLFRRRWALIVACTLVAGLAAWFTTPANPTNDDVTYAATHQILRDSSAVAPQALATVSLFVKTGEVPERVAERLDYSGEPAILAGGVTLEPDEQVGTLEITARGSSPEQAAERANAFAEETLALLGETNQQAQEDNLARVNERLLTLQAEIDSLNDRILEESFAGEAPGVLEAERDAKLRQYGAALDQQQQLLNAPPPSAGYVTLQEALPELAEVEGGGFSAPRSRPARTALASAIGLFLGLIAALVIERLDTRLHDTEEITEAFGLPVVAEIPIAAKAKRGRVALDLDPMSALSESFRTLRSAVMLTPVTVMGLKAGHQSGLGREPQVILITSPAPGDGKTTTAANLAAAIAETGRSVLVLGCDFRRPEIHAFYDRPNSPGVADVLSGSRGALVDVVVPTAVPGVSLAPSGASLKNLGDVAALGRELIGEARTLADVVVIDTPPLLATNDASELIPAVDAVVIVSRVAKTTEDAARRTRFLLDRLGAPVSGVVAVGAEKKATSYASYYSSSAKGVVAPPDDRAEVVEAPPERPAPASVPTEAGSDQTERWAAQERDEVAADDR
jgi:Mrp family chromosome partitioning ATPase